MEGFFGGVALVVGASGDDVLVGGVTVFEADDTKAEHGVGKTRTDEGEGAGSLPIFFLCMQYVREPVVQVTKIQLLLI